MEVREPGVKYLAQPAFKQTEVGVIPEDWEVCTLEEVTDPKRPISYGIVQTGPSVQNGVPCLRVVDIDDGRIKKTDLITTSQTISNAYKRTILRSGDLVMPLRGKVGDVALIGDELAGCNLTRGVAVIAVLRDRNALYCKHFIASPATRTRLMQSMNGSALQEIPIAPLRAFEIALPSTLAEQQAIAEALSDADALTESLEQLVAKKSQIKQGAMQELLTGQKRLPGFSGEWRTKPLSELFDFSGGFTASRDQLGLDGHCYLHYGDIHTSNKTYVDVRAEFQDIPKLGVPLKKVGSASLLEDGDVVFVDASEDDEGTSKHVVVCNPDKTPFISGLHTIVAKSKGGVLDNLYKRYCFQTPEVRAQFRFFAVGTKVSGVSKSNIGKVVIFVPPVAEQTAIATILSDMDAELAALETKLTKARQLKQGMMQELLTGRVRLV